MFNNNKEDEPKKNKIEELEDKMDDIIARIENIESVLEIEPEEEENFEDDENEEEDDNN